MVREIRADGSPATTRAEIEETRARMSDTIGELEEVLLQKRARLRESLDLRARLAEKPMLAVGLVLGAGLIVGFLTSGGDRDRSRAIERGRRDWDGRSGRMLDLLREHEERIADLECAFEEYPVIFEGDGEEGDSSLARWSGLAERVGAFVAEGGRSLFDEVRRRI